MERKKNVFLISLGCAKNLVDSENILGLLRENQFSVVSRIEDASIAIVNTCAFIQRAVEETIDAIIEAASFKTRGNLEKLIVVGCFVQRYGYKLSRELPEVDGWLGTGEISRIVDIIVSRVGEPTPFFIGRPTYLADHATPRTQTTPFHSAYLKIAEGCSHRCSFCIIPSLRGPFRSRELGSLISEAESMVAKGVKEINLIAQDTTMYGTDLETAVRLEDLLEKLLDIKGITWLRILYCNPGNISDRLLEIIEGEDVVCPYIDLPMQHINEKILQRMGRSFGEKKLRRLIRRIRSLNRPVSIRTTFMVGFPGETEDIFNELYAFVKMTEFDHMGVFVYSPEKGTPASRLNRVPDREAAEKRLETLMTLQAGISKKRYQRLAGSIVPVLLEGPSQETELLLKGRMSTMAPDVDGQVLINRGEGIVGDIVPVRISEAHAYDLIGEIVESY